MNLRKLNNKYVESFLGDYIIGINKVSGKNNAHKIFLYTLSTCGWCKKAKNFLKDCNVEYEYLDLDTVSYERRMEELRNLRKRSIKPVFPIIFIDDKTIIGFDLAAVKEALGI